MLISARARPSPRLLPFPCSAARQRQPLEPAPRGVKWLPRPSHPLQTAYWRCGPLGDRRRSSQSARSPPNGPISGPVRSAGRRRTITNSAECCPPQVRTPAAGPARINLAILQSRSQSRSRSQSHSQRRVTSAATLRAEGINRGRAPPAVGPGVRGGGAKPSRPPSGWPRRDRLLSGRRGSAIKL